MPQIVGTAVIEIVGDASAFNATLAGLGSKTSAAMATGIGGSAALAGGLGKVSSSFTGLGASATSMGKALGGFTVAAALFGVLGVKAVYDFDTSMRRVGAVLGANREEFDKLDAVAQKLGRDTEFTAAQAADGMVKLATAGFSTNEILQAIPGTLRLASAGQFGLAEATGIAADTLRSFGMVASEVGRVNDVLANTFVSSNTTLLDLAYAMKYVAPVAEASGVSFEETTAALGLLANAGLKASLGGTALRGAIVKLEKPTKQGAEVIDRLGIVTKDSAGKLLPLENIIGQLEKTSFSTADAITVFGQRAGPGFLSLVSVGSEALRELTQANKEAGNELKTATKELGLNKDQQDNLRFAFLKSYDTVSKFKFNIDDTTSVLAAFVKRGFNAQQAQEKLEKAMSATKNNAILPLIGATRRLNGTLVDADGDVLSFQSVLRLLEGAGLTSAQALDLFGESGAALFETMKLPAKEISNLSDKMANSGTAAEIAAKQMEGVKGGLKRFTSSLQGIAIVAFGGKDGIINKLADAADAVARFMNRMMEQSPGAIKAIVGIVFALGGLGLGLRIMGSLLKAFGGLVKVFQVLATNPAILGFIILAGVLIGAYKSSEDFRTSLRSLFDQVKELFNAIGDLLSPAIGAAGDAMQGAKDKTSALSDAFKIVGDTISDVIKKIEVKIFQFRLEMQKLTPQQIETIRTAFDNAKDAIKKFLIVAGGLAASWAVISAVIFTVSVIIGALTTLFGFLSSPIVLTVAAIAGLIFAFKTLYERSAPLRDFIQGLSDKFKEFTTGITVGKDLIKEGITPIENFGVSIRGAYDTIIDKFQEFATGISNGKDLIREGITPLEDFGAAIRIVFDAVKDITFTAVIEGFKTIKQLIEGDFEGASKTARDALDILYDKIRDLPRVIGEVVSQAFDFLGNLSDSGARVTDSIYTTLIGAISNVPSLQPYIENLIDPFAKGIFSAIKASFDNFSGISDIISGIFTLDPVKIQEGIDKSFEAIGNLLSISIPSIAASLGYLFSTIIPVALEDFKKRIENVPFVGKIAELIIIQLQGISEAAGSFSTIIAGIFNLDGGQIASGFTNLFNSILTTVKTALPAAFDAIKQLFKDIIPGTIDALIPKIEDFPILGSWGASILTTIKGGAQILGGLGDIIAGIFTFDMTKILGGFDRIGQGIATWIVDLPAFLLDYVADMGEAFAGLIEGAADYIVKEAPKFFKKLKDLPEILGNFIVGLFKPGKGGKGGKKKDMAGEGLIDGFKSFFSRLPGIFISLMYSSFKIIITLIPGILGVLADWGLDLIKLLFNVLKGIGGWLVTKLPPLLVDGIKLAFDAVVRFGPLILLKIVNWLIGLPAIIFGFLGDLGAKLLEWVKVAFDWIVENGPIILFSIGEWLVSLPGKILGFLGDLGGTILGWVKMAFDWIVENGPGILLTVGEWLISLPGKILGFLGDLGGTILGWVKGAFDWIVENGPGILATVGTWLGELPGKLIGFIGDLGTKLFDFIKGGFDVVKERGPEVLSGIVDFFSGIPGKLVDALSSVATGGINLANKLWGPIARFINTKLLDPLRDVSIFGKKPFGFLPQVNDVIELAEGGIFTKATNAVIGEAGAEAVIPLTNPARAKELLVQSGLINILTETQTTITPTGESGLAGLAFSGLPSAPDTQGISATITTSMTNVVEAAVTALQPVKDWFAALSTFAIDSLSAFGQQVWDGTAATFKFFVAQVLTVLTGLTAFIAAWPMTITGLLADTGARIWFGMAGGMAAFASSFKAVFADLGVFATNWSSGLVLGFGGLPAFMGGVAAGITAAVTAPFRTFASGIWNPFATTLTGALDQIPATANINIPQLMFPTAHSGGVVGGRLPQTGGPLDSSEMLVKMQRGEGVIPASSMKGMTDTEFDMLRRGDFGERDPRDDKKMAARFLPQTGSPASAMPPLGAGSFSSLPSSILEGLKDALKTTFAQAKNLAEEAFYAPKYLGGIAQSAAFSGLGFVGQKIDEANKAAAEAAGGVGTAFPAGFPAGLPAAIEAMRRVAGRVGSFPALINYMKETGVPFKAISTTRPGATTRGSGNTRPSLHSSSRAVDFAGLRPSRDSPELLRIYQAFEPVRDILAELIYSGPGGGLVKNPITRADHHDHVHAGLANGAIIASRMTATLGEAGREVVIPLTRPMRALQLAEDSGLIGVLSQAAGQRAASAAATGGVPPAATPASSVQVQGLFPGQGNTYNIYGISMAQVIAEIEAREQASARVNFVRH